MTKGIHRAVAGTKRARQLAAATSSSKSYKNTNKEIEEWNRKVDEAKEKKRAT